MKSALALAPLIVGNHALPVVPFDHRRTHNVRQISVSISSALRLKVSPAPIRRTSSQPCSRSSQTWPRHLRSSIGVSFRPPSESMVAKYPLKPHPKPPAPLSQHTPAP